MRQFYVVQTAVLAANPPDARYHALQAPGAPQFSLVVVERWSSDDAGDRWEDLPSVTEHYIENWGAIVPQGMVTAFGPFGVLPTDTIRQAMRKIRANWSPARP